MQPLPGVMRDGDDLQETALFNEVIQRENNLLAIIFLQDFIPLMCGSEFSWRKYIKTIY
jgi:hypothetical protein